jgi:hypothetical protein
LAAISTASPLIELSCAARQLFDQRLGVLQRGFWSDVILRANFIHDNFFERRHAVGRFPDDGGDFVQREQRGIGG